MIRSLIKPKRKKGGIGIIMFFFVLLSVLVIGFIATIAWTVIDIASDEITPVMEDLGMVEQTNMSEISGYTFGTMDSIVQALPWIIALGYVMALVFTLVFVFVVGYTPHPAFIAFYFALMILLIFGCVLMSNMYQDIYGGTDEMATRLQEQTVMSYLLLHSPFIMAMIAIIGGILMFARQSNSEGGNATGGGFGV